jgi:tellurite resistance-related uncharacterized protein
MKAPIMKTLPDNLTHYKSTPEFNQDSVPAGLLRKHTTGADVWGRIVVQEGSLRYCIEEPQAQQHLLEPGRVGVIEPQVAHHVEVIGPVRFLVEFHR